MPKVTQQINDNWDLHSALSDVTGLTGRRLGCFPEICLHPQHRTPTTNALRDHAFLLSPQHLPQSPPSPPSRHGDCSRAPLATVREPRTLIPIFICLSRLFDLQPFLPHPLSPEASSPRRPQRMNDVICALDLTGPSYQAISGNARCVPTGKNTPSLPGPGELGRVHGCPRTRHSGTFSDHGGLSRVPPTCDH